MMKKLEFVLAIVALLGIAIHAMGQVGERRQRPWLEPKNPSRLEWLALQKQATEGDNEFGENGMTVNFYLGPVSFRTGEILCDLAYLLGTEAELVQMVEDGILRRFAEQRSIDAWARVKIIKKVARLN